MVNLTSFWNTDACGVTRQVNLKRAKIGGKCQNKSSKETSFSEMRLFSVIFQPLLKVLLYFKWVLLEVLCLFLASVLVSYYEARRGKKWSTLKTWCNWVDFYGNLFFGFSRTLWWLLKRKRWPSPWQPWEPWKNDALPTSPGPRLFPAFSPWNLAFGA